MLHARFKFNLRFKTFGEFFARLCALLIYAAGARLLGADGFGLFSLAFSYAMLSSTFIDSGTLNIITRNLARDKASGPDMIRTLTLYKFMVAPFAVLAIYGMVYFLDRGGPTASLVRITGVVAVGTAMSEHLSAILSGLERMDIEAGIKILNRVGAFIFAVAFYYLQPTVGGFTAGMAFGLWISVFVGLRWLHKNVVPFELKIDWPLLKRLLRTAAPLFAAWVFITLYNNLDRYVLQFLDFSKRDIGLYSASAKLIDALRPIPVLLMGAVFPIVSEAAVKDRALFEKISGTLVKYSVVALIPFAFGVTVFAPLIVRLVFGPEFVGTAPILQIAIWGFAIIFVNHLFLYLLVSSDQQRKFFQGAVILMVVNAVLCWTLFKVWSLRGGAWAMIGSETALLLFNVAASPWARRQIRTLFGTPLLLGTASVALFFLLRAWIPAPAAWILSVVAYGLLVRRAAVVDIQLLRRFVV